ncbi:peptidoglycan-binding domain-containing protein [Geomonas oryzae]|uniref:peptidoglycan-binding domain-containing protein n=1 Tax=Geomonas oryzae TaxID=2364273 RepID=UPI0018E0AB85|nr:peptidoglycan-binding domain-containing protein [Geomonas oryzae]
MATGNDIVNLASQHIGERYLLGTAVPKDNASWVGPWDCAEFASWCIYQVSQQLYGCENGECCPPSQADAYTGYWGRDVRCLGTEIPLQQAAATPGAFVLRNPGRKCGHIVISDGTGGTIEAHSTARGVICDTLSGRRWDTGILVPWIQYSPLAQTPVLANPGTIYRVKKPMQSGAIVLEIQKALQNQGINPGILDGVYGCHTAAAVQAFQISRGLVVDGEVGPVTAAALGITLGRNARGGRQ